MYLKGTVPQLAYGGITNGVSIAGEGAWREAVIPLPDGRSVPVTVNGSADNRETVAELKETVRQLEAVVRVLQSGFTQLIDQGTESNQTGKVMSSGINLQKAA